MECQICRHKFENTEYEECPKCKSISGNTYLRAIEGQTIESSSSFFKRGNIRSKIEYSKSLKKLKITNISNSRIITSKLEALSNAVTSILIHKVAGNVDEGFDMIRVNVDEAVTKATDKIISNVNASMKTIIETSNDPNMRIVAKALYKHSPRIALLIASYALAGIPYGTLITQIVGIILNQIGNSDESSSNKIANTLNADTVSPIVEKLLPKSFCKSSATRHVEMNKEKE